MTAAHDREAVNGQDGPTQEPAGIYTATLARLYWQQGHLAKALAIYRHLAHLHPDNAAIREQMSRLQTQLAVEPPGHTSALGPVRRSDVCNATARVVTHLERWLAQVRRQRWGSEKSADT